MPGLVPFGCWTQPDPAATASFPSRIQTIEAVRALAGVMEDLNASRGVLVTTSWFGKTSIDFCVPAPTHPAHRRRRIKVLDQETPREGCHTRHDKIHRP
ncbi:restriction endonuclease [Nocardia sp. JCM 34519]|uniref:restriction endonuclease n=1 Tax=Nocardia sp. JCM 34519 TaxID=2876118 RepID=UPI0035ABE8F1